ncbi:MAG TPA: MerR family transcriptional regulator, partial [Pseudonocardia sp.]|nr:MerR family transcriptional regulator [Pseudonocardia sp.]
MTVSATARRLGIAPATLRTWDRRYGLGPSAHTPGKHRRYSSDDVARLELMQHALVRGAAPAEAARYAKSVRLPGRTGDDAAAPADRPRAVPPPPDGTPGGEPGVEHVTREDTGDLGDPLLVADEDGHAASRVRVGGRVLRLPGAGRRARGLGRAALALDAATIRRLLAEAIAADGVVSA